MEKILDSKEGARKTMAKARIKVQEPQSLYTTPTLKSYHNSLSTQADCVNKLPPSFLRHAPPFLNEVVQKRTLRNQYWPGCSSHARLQSKSSYSPTLCNHLESDSPPGSVVHRHSDKNMVRSMAQEVGVDGVRRGRRLACEQSLCTFQS